MPGLFHAPKPESAVSALSNALPYASTVAWPLAKDQVQEKPKEVFLTGISTLGGRAVV